MATPHVTGAIALYAASNPSADAKTIRTKVLDTATATSSLRNKTVTGDRLDVGRLLAGSPSQPQPTAPSTPVNLYAQAASAGSVSLTWNAGGTNEAGFRIDASTNGVNFSTVASAKAAPGKPTVTALVTGLSASTTYTFRVLAYNSAGLSGASNEADATTHDLVPISSTDSFEGGTLSPDWTFTAGAWGIATDPAGSTNHVLKQTSSTSATPTMMKALLTGFDGDATEVRARLRVDSWRQGEYARAGVGLRTDPATGNGYNLVFTGRHVDGRLNVEILNDTVAWSGPGPAGPVEFVWNPSTWYQFYLKLEGGVLYGKVWVDGTPEPSDWTITYDAADHGWNRTGGVASLYGGYPGTLNATQGPSYATASFDDVTVSGFIPEPAGSMAPSGLASASAGAMGITSDTGGSKVTTSFITSPTANGNAPELIESYLLPDDPTWVDEVLAEGKKRDAPGSSRSSSIDPGPCRFPRGGG